MSSITKRIDNKRKKEVVQALRQFAHKLDTGQLILIRQGMWNGVTSDRWIFNIEVKENPVPVLSETLSED